MNGTEPNPMIWVILRGYIQMLCPTLSIFFGILKIYNISEDRTKSVLRYKGTEGSYSAGPSKRRVNMSDNLSLKV
jgi:hypothetical protein